MLICVALFGQYDFLFSEQNANGLERRENFNIHDGDTTLWLITRFDSIGRLINRMDFITNQRIDITYLDNSNIVLEYCQNDGTMHSKIFVRGVSHYSVYDEGGLEVEKLVLNADDRLTHQYIRGRLQRLIEYDDQNRISNKIYYGINDTLVSEFSHYPFWSMVAKNSDGKPLMLHVRLKALDFGQNSYYQYQQNFHASGESITELYLVEISNDSEVTWLYDPSSGSFKPVHLIKYFFRD